MIFDIVHIKSSIIDLDHITRVMYFQDSATILMERSEELHIIKYLILISFVVNGVTICIIHFLVSIGLLVGWIMLYIMFSLAIILYNVILVLIILLFLALMLYLVNCNMLIIMPFLTITPLLINWYTLYIVDYLHLIIYYKSLIILIMPFNKWVLNLKERSIFTPLDLVRIIAKIAITLIMNNTFRSYLILMWISFPALKILYLVAIQGMEFEMACSITYNLERFRDHHRLVINNSLVCRFNNTVPELLNPVVPVPVPVPVLSLQAILPAPVPVPAIVPAQVWIGPEVYHYTHRSKGPGTSVSRQEIESLSIAASNMGFFSIDHLNMLRGTCRVTFHQPVPYLNDTAKIALLKELHSYFPNGDDYSKYWLPHTLHDPYRVQAIVAKTFDAWGLDPRIIVRSDQQSQNLSPYYDSTRPDLYRPWARDIAYTLISHPHAQPPKLDSYSEIFLATFRNAHENLSPTHYTKQVTIDALRDL